MVLRGLEDIVGCLVFVCGTKLSTFLVIGSAACGLNLMALSQSVAR